MRTLQEIFDALSKVENGGDMVVSLQEHLSKTRDEAASNRVARNKVLDALGLRDGDDLEGNLKSLVSTLSAVKKVGDPNSLGNQMATLQQQVKDLSDKYEASEAKVKEEAEKARAERAEKAVKAIEKKQKEIDVYVDNRLKTLGEDIDKRIASGTEKYFQNNIEDSLKQVYSRITQLSDMVDSKITSKLKGMETRITQLDTSISTTVNNKIKGIESRIVQLDNAIDSKISDKVYRVESRITQTTNAIQSTVNDKLRQMESTINQTKYGIESRVEEAVDGLTGEKIVSKINQSARTVSIDSEYVHITGKTKIDSDLIVKNIGAGSISADKLNVNSLSAITANLGTVTAGKIKGLRYESRTGGAWIEDDEIHGMKISADAFYEAGYRVKNVEIVTLRFPSFTKIKYPAGTSSKNFFPIKIQKGATIAEFETTHYEPYEWYKEYCKKIGITDKEEMERIKDRMKTYISKLDFPKASWGTKSVSDGNTEVDGTTDVGYSYYQYKQDEKGHSGGSENGDDWHRKYGRIYIYQLEVVALWIMN